MEPTQNYNLNNEEVAKDRNLVHSGMDKDIKKQFSKAVILFSILCVAIVVYSYINYRYEREFKREFELPGAPVEGV